MPTAKVLVIEDNPMNMELASDLLRARGYDVLQAATALEALGVLQEFKPDLILMDIQLPGLNGLDLTKRLKEDPRTKEIPIIAICHEGR
jgi:two-component system cell cycle response regulator DivK